MKEKQIDGLKDSERVFQMASGDLAKVTICRTLQDEKVLCFRVGVCMVDPVGAPIENGGVPCKCPDKVVTLQASALAEGQTTIEQEMATATVQALDRMANQAVALAAWARVPSEEEPS